MCRCCQRCWEDFYWHCFEERFCYDESIANYNADEDTFANHKNGKSNGNTLGYLQAGENNNDILRTTTRTPSLATNVICEQPLKGGGTGYNNLLSQTRMHEDEYRRETQINVPILGPEILAVFANSQIFQDHQPTRLSRINSKVTANLVPIHNTNLNNNNDDVLRRQQSNENLIKRIEGNLMKQNSNATLRRNVEEDGGDEDLDNNPNASSSSHNNDNNNKRIIFTITSDSSPEGSQSLTSKRFDVIREEELSVIAPLTDGEQSEVLLRPRLIGGCHQQIHSISSNKVSLRGEDQEVVSVAPSTLTTPAARKVLRSVKSVPHLRVCPVASETDIFSITGSGNTISMTPEVPSISFTHLPKNYEDTPTIEKYRASQSLYSIQAANAVKASQEDYSMPRYFRRSPHISQSTEMLAQMHTSSSQVPMPNHHKDPGREESFVRRPEKEKSKRLQKLRGTLPPLLIHSVSFRKTRDESKQLN